jgi:hypothetical protein
MGTRKSRGVHRLNREVAVRYLTMTRLGLVLAAIGGVAACGKEAGPTEEPGGPAFESRWDMTVTVRYVKGSSNLTCDGRDLLGAANPGEYQYRIAAAYGSTVKQAESQSYGSVIGISYSLMPEEIYNFANEDWSFNDLQAGQSVALTLSSTEWDGTSKDDYMNDRSNILTLTPSTLRPTGGTSTDRALGVGHSDCGLTLYYDVAIVQRQVATD